MKTVYSFFSPRCSAVSWYRVEQPIRTLESLGLIKSCNCPQLGEELRYVSRSQFEADIIWSHHGLGLDISMGRDSLHDCYSRYHSVGRLNRLKSRLPLFVFDVDDDLRHLESNNYTFLESVNRNIDPYLLYLFGIAQCSSPEGVKLNAIRERIENRFRRNLDAADIVVCATPNLETDFRNQLCINNGIYTISSCIDFSEYEGVSHVECGEVRILWQGGLNHRRCLEECVPTLRRIHDAYKNVRIIVWGAEFYDLWAGFERISFIPPVAFGDFYQRINSIGHDIALAPLARNQFNRARSATKFYESAACSKPAACVASNWGAFETDIIHRSTGLLFDDQRQLFENLALLIEDPSFRRHLAEQGKQWCRQNRDPRTYIPKVWNHIERLLP